MIAFEPNASARRVLNRHLRMNEIDRRVTVVPCALSHTQGTAMFFSAPAHGMSRLGRPNPVIADQAEARRVQVSTLDAYVEATGIAPDWLIVDVEGFEIAVLRGAMRTVRALPDLQLVVEIHPSAWPAAETSREEAEEILKGLRLRPVPLTGQVDPMGEYGIVHLERC